MSPGRRTNDRRRRVLYSVHQADHFPATAASRRETERLREARRPPSAYGSRVHRRLRARWFSLVPVRRRTLGTIAVLFATLAVVLCAAHYASVAWPTLAYRPELARPLRLDRPDSFGRWFMVALLAASAGTAFLIYQLRRYRNDDFTGRYRLWRLVLIVMLLASLNAHVSIIDWVGALLDVGFGKRVALTGGDWVRLIVSLGGAVLALQMVAEVRRSRFALSLMVLACMIGGITEAAKWKVLQVDSLGKWVIATSAPLLACTALFIALVGYLRMLYREVRQIEERDSLRERYQRIRMRVFQRSDQGEAESDEEDETDASEPKRRWWRRRPKADKAMETDDPRQTEAPQTEAKDDTAASSPRARRRWFGLRRAKVQGDAGSGEQAEAGLPGGEAARIPPRKQRGRFSMRLAPPASGQGDDSTEAAVAPEQAEPSDESVGPAAGRRSGLGGWLRRKKPSASDANGQSAAETGSNERVESSDGSDDDNIDWDSLNKSERRRLRKQLKRQQRAA